MLVRRDPTEKTRRDLQDFTALNTIVRAFERVKWEPEPSAFARALLATLSECGADVERPTPALRVGSPLWRRAHRMGLVVRRRRSSPND